MCHMSSNIALAILLSLKALDIFPDKEFWLKNGPKLTLPEKIGKSGNFAKTIIFYFNVFQR